VESVNTLQRNGLQVMGGFIVGFDTDTSSIFRRQVEFIQKSGIVTAMVGLLQALPGTKLHQRLGRQGRLLGRTTGDNVDGTTNFIPQMNMEILRQGYKNLMEYIYSPGPYYQRIRTFLRDYKPPKISTSLNWRSLMAFFHANLRLGILGRERFHYWRLIIWTFFHRPSLLSMAVTFSIYGHHFRKIVRVLG
jgi:radical SAM superfamily enzyme YgiQ (UPF0313 family)